MFNLRLRLCGATCDLVLVGADDDSLVRDFEAFKASGLDARRTLGRGPVSFNFNLTTIRAAVIEPLDQMPDNAVSIWESPLP
jgi:hypothetical protein